MKEFYSHTNDFLVGFYQEIQRYAQITFSLFQQKLLDYDQALYKIRAKLYDVYDLIHGFLLPIERKVQRFNKQVLATIQVYNSLFQLDSLLIK